MPGDALSLESQACCLHNINFIVQWRTGLVFYMI